MENGNKLQLALEFATEKHKGQKRIGGDDYITHPVAVCEIVKSQDYDENYQIAALFHDLLEDTDATDEEILKYGNKEVLDAVKLLTKEKGYVMAEYIQSIKENPIAKAVKLADLQHNSDITRLDRVDEKALKRAEKYKQAMKLLSDGRFKYYRYCGGKIVKHDTSKDLFYSRDENGEWKLDGHALAAYFDSATEYTEIGGADL